MKKLLVLVLSLALLCCFSLTALAKDNGKGHTDSSEETLLTAEGEDTAVSDGDMTNGQLKKQENALKKRLSAVVITRTGNKAMAPFTPTSSLAKPYV